VKAWRIRNSCERNHVEPGDVVILDNLASHKGKVVRTAIRNVGARLVFLPKYSPDFNPIEQVFAKFKTLSERQEHEAPKPYAKPAHRSEECPHTTQDVRKPQSRTL
jgi:transposase